MAGGAALIEEEAAVLHHRAQLAGQIVALLLEAPTPVLVGGAVEGDLGWPGPPCDLKDTDQLSATRHFDVVDEAHGACFGIQGTKFDVDRQGGKLGAGELGLKSDSGALRVAQKRSLPGLVGWHCTEEVRDRVAPVS